MKYQVEITREDATWIADVLNLPGAHTYALSLTSLKKEVEEVIRLVEDLPDRAPLDVEYSYEGFEEIVLQALDLSRKRSVSEALQEDILRQTSQLLPQLQEQRYSVRDISEMLGISPGRVTQLKQEAKKSELQSQ